MTLTNIDTETLPEAVRFRTAHDQSIVIRSLEERQESIEKLAKKNEEEGYHREARTQRADAAAIKTFIIPVLRGQTEMKLANADQVRAGIANRIRPLVHGAIVVKAPEDRQEDALHSRESMLCERLALYVEHYASAIAEEAYAAGYAARATDPEAIALRTLHALDA